MHIKCGSIEFGLGSGFVIEMTEAVGAARQCCGQPGRPDMAHAGRDVADADADPSIVAAVCAGAVDGERVVQ